MLFFGFQYVLNHHNLRINCGFHSLLITDLYNGFVKLEISEVGLNRPTQNDLVIIKKDYRKVGGRLCHQKWANESVD